MIAKKVKCSSLAQIAVEILLCLVFLDETQKIATESGTIYPKKPNISAPINNQTQIDDIKI